MIHLEAESWHFGDLARDRAATDTLEIQNLGDQPLELHHVRSSCACLLILFEPATLAPGNGIRIPIRYVPDRKKGEIAKTIFIDSNDPENPRLRFVVEGNILEAQAGEIRVEPNPCYVEAAPGWPTEADFTLRNVGSGTLALSAAWGSGCEVDGLAIGPVDPGVRVPFRARFEPDELWTFNYFVFLESSDPAEPFLIVPIHPILDEETSVEQSLDELGAAPEDTVRALLFASLDCSHCLALKTYYFPRITEFFEGRFVLQTTYVDLEENYTWLVNLERELGDTGNEIPALVLGTEILDGHRRIVEDLPGRLTELFREGGCRFPARMAGPEAATRTARADTIHLAYFRKVGCKECDRAGFMLRRLTGRFAPVEVRTFELTSPPDQELNEALCEAYGVPERRRLVAPSLFGGGRYLIDEALDDTSAEEMLSALSKNGSSPPWVEVEAFRADARQSIISRFQSLGPLTIILGGLVDGINPCAFATLIFFVSYLTFVGRAGREILWIGTAFTAAVFLTYLLVGLGAFTFLQSLSVFRVLSNIVYGATAVLAVGLGIYSLRDFFILRRGEPGDVGLQLPDFLKRRIHKEIRERARTRRYVLAAFITGAIVSLLELACTGQVYLPTICFVTGVPELRAHAIGCLLLYNLMFIVPLVIVFLLSYFGTTSDQMAGFFRTHIAAVKLALAVFFFALAGILVSVLV